MMFAQTKQRQRYADVIIEIARADENRTRLSKNSADHFLDSGFAVTAGHTNYRDIETRAPMCCELPQRGSGVLEDQTRQRI